MKFGTSKKKLNSIPRQYVHTAYTAVFAACPVDFEHNHPELSQEMRAAWREVWPGCMDVVDLRVAVATYMDPAMNGNGGSHGPPPPPPHPHAMPHSYHGGDTGSLNNETRPLL